MWLEVRNIQTLVTRATEDEIVWLTTYLSFEDKEAQWRRGNASGRLQLFNYVKLSFPTGLLPAVRKGAMLDGIVLNVADRRVRPCEPDPTADIAWLRDYQHEAVQRFVARGRGIMEITTGGGKTECFAALTRVLPCRWLFLVHRTSLVHQAADRVELRTGMRVGRIGEGHWDSDARVICASFQMLYARRHTPEAKALLVTAEGVCVDESHVVPARTFYRITMMTRHAYWRLGLSGTPLARGDEKSNLAVAAIGPVLYKVSPQKLQAAGVLARPRIHMLPVTQQSTCPTWQGVYGECVVRSSARNRTVVGAAKAAPKPCLIFVKEVEHGKRVEAGLLKAGVRAEFVWGADSTKERQRTVERLVRGDLDVVVCSVIFQEGIDIPSLRSVVVASGGKSVIAALQRIGRGMRVTVDKNEFFVYDIADRGNRMLERHTKDRVNAYLSQGHQTVVESLT